jgi:capsular polysaccharide biosynthesis protein
LELADYFRILLRRSWIIVLLVAITAASAWGFSKLQTPVYRASVRVRIDPARADFGLAQTAKLLLRSYVSVIDTDKWAAKVVQRLNLDMTPGGLRSHVTVASDESRLLIEIEVRDYDLAQAKAIADAYGLEVEIWRQEENADQLKEDQVKAEVTDWAAGGLFSPKTTINTIAGGIFGLLLAGVIIFFLEWVESGVVRSTGDVERYLGLPVLGAIPPAE